VIPFLCGGRDDHGRSRRERHRSPSPQHRPALPQEDLAAFPVKQAIPGPAYDGYAARKSDDTNSGAFRVTDAGVHPHGPVVTSSRPVEDKTRQAPAPQFARRADDDDVPTAGNNQLDRGSDHGGEDDSKYRTKSRVPFIR
jgi:hypothetical protein